MAGAGSAVGALLIIVGRIGADNRTTVDAQVSWLNLAVLGTAVGVASGLALIITARQRVAHGRRVVLGLLTVPDSRPDPAVGSNGPLVTVDNGTWVHRSSCPVVVGKPTRSTAQHVDDDDRCPICGSGS